ncbi:MAG: transposase [Candidatus Hydrogenedentes bacterium]|nr:transposase [Candidatus Hydrogenedentota bacterium]
MGRSRYRFVDVTQPHFMTCTVLHWVPVFTRAETVEILLDSLRYLSKEGLKVYAYVVLENHMHIIAQSTDLSRDISRFKSYTAKQVLAYLKENQVKTVLDQLAFYKKAHKGDRSYQFWQEGVHAEWIQGDEMMRQKIAYIHNNPVSRGYVDEPEHWRYSSARNYAGREGLLDVATEW